MDYQRRLNRRMQARRAANGLGWFSIGLGLVELLFARPLARSLGMRGEEGLLRLYGAREIANGLGILGAEDPTPWLWGRVGGDALDIATLVAKLDAGSREKVNIALALGAVAGVTALDVLTANRLAQTQRPRQATRDYSDRVGLGRAPEALRGAALKDFEVPRDMRVPELMRPRLH
jgi:hypothetical protein